MGQGFVFGQFAVAPAVRLGHRFVQRLMGVVKPCGAGVVVVLEGAFLKCLGFANLSDALFCALFDETNALLEELPSAP